MEWPWYGLGMPHARAGQPSASTHPPIMPVQGRAVGLNAGGRVKSSVAFYLPLERVVRALQLVQVCFRGGCEWELGHAAASLFFKWSAF